MKRPGPNLRSRAILRVEHWLRQRDMPRLQMSIIVSLTGLAALVFSIAMLYAGVTRMAIRYPVAVLLSYLVFLVLLRLWIALQVHRPMDVDALDAADALDLAEGSVDLGFHAGSSIHDSSQRFLDLDWDLGGLDLDAAFFLILAALSVLAGAIVCVAVIWSAPSLLAEILVDGVVMAGVYHRLKASDRQNWLTGAVRRTALPALSLALFLAAAGWSLQHLAPDAASIGPVLEHLASRRGE